MNLGKGRIKEIKLRRSIDGEGNILTPNKAIFNDGNFRVYVQGVQGYESITNNSNINYVIHFFSGATGSIISQSSNKTTELHGNMFYDPSSSMNKFSIIGDYVDRFNGQWIVININDITLKHDTSYSKGGVDTHHFKAARCNDDLTVKVGADPHKFNQMGYDNGKVIGLPLIQNLAEGENYIARISNNARFIDKSLHRYIGIFK